jgi:hypothetical protein
LGRVWRIFMEDGVVVILSVREGVAVVEVEVVVVVGILDGI